MCSAAGDKGRNRLMFSFILGIRYIGFRVSCQAFRFSSGADIRPRQPPSSGTANPDCALSSICFHCPGTGLSRRWMALDHQPRVTGNESLYLLSSLLPCCTHRKQDRLGGRSIGNGLKLRILPAERLRHLYFRSFQDADELQGVHDGLTLKVIVGDHERLAGPLRNFADARDPGPQLFSGVKIVVTLMSWDRRIVAEPRVVAPAVKPHVPDCRGRLSGGRKRSPDDGLVDVAETDAAGVQQFQRFGRLPGSVANFDDQGIVCESLENSGEIRHGLRGAMKRKRELQQDRAKSVGCSKHIEARANGPLIHRAYVRSCGPYVVREPLPQLRGKGETQIRRHAIDPLRCEVRAQRLVKRTVDLDSVKELREIGSLVESFGTARRINVPGPVGIRPACGADAEYTGRRGIG